MRKETLRAIKEHLLGPVGSVVLHVLIILLLMQMVLGSTGQLTPNVPVMIMEQVQIEVDLEDIPQVDPPPQVQDQPTPFDGASPDMPTAEVATPTTSTLDTSALAVVDTAGILIMEGFYVDRSAAARQRGLQQWGGDQATERAVMNALRWLKRNQSEDGSWGDRNSPGLTGLGLLTFLAHGETPDSEEFGDTVTRAIRYLLSQQREDGTFVDVTRGNQGVYNHGIATYAIAEAFGMTRMPILRPAMEMSLEAIVRGQQRGGLWDYRYAKGNRQDLSVSGWQIQALKAGVLAQAEVDGLREALFLAAEGLKTMQRGHGEYRRGRSQRDTNIQNRTGHFGYTSASWRNPGMTGVGVLSLQIMGLGETDMARHGLQALESYTIDWEDLGTWMMVGTYYVTQAKINAGNRSEWDRWNEAMKKALPPNQNADGSWTVSNNERGHGPVYATTLSALSLMVYYRNLPTFQQPEAVTRPAATAAADEASPDDGVGVQVH